MSATPSTVSRPNNFPAVVLVHGAWHGAWCWQRVLPLLQAEGLSAHAVTLTGVGDRAHLLSEHIRLSTHVADVLGLIDSLELERVLLVGHSYGGMVVTGVADALLRRTKQAPVIHGMVYVDAVTPHPGESWSSQHARETIASRLKLVAEQGGGVGMPPPDASVFGLQGEARDWVNRRQTPHPVSVYQDPLWFDARALAALPRWFIDCTTPALPTIDVMRQRVRSEPGWRVLEMRTGHDPMVSEPRGLARYLAQAAWLPASGESVA